MTLERTWAGVDRGFVRRLNNRHQARRLCPHRVAAGRTNDRALLNAAMTVGKRACAHSCPVLASKVLDALGLHDYACGYERSGLGKAVRTPAATMLECAAIETPR